MHVLPRWESKPFPVDDSELFFTWRCRGGSKGIRIVVLVQLQPVVYILFIPVSDGQPRVEHIQTQVKVSMTATKCLEEGLAIQGKGAT